MREVGGKVGWVAVRGGAGTGAEGDGGGGEVEAGKGEGGKGGRKLFP